MQLQNTLRYDLNAVRKKPRIVEVDPRILPEPWKGICLRNGLRLHALIGYENESKSIKIWPAGNIIARGIERGEHLKTNTIAESTSGNFGISTAEYIEELHRRDPGFPIDRLVFVVPRSLQEDKKALLRAHACVELVEADDSAEAMRLVESLSLEEGWWYTRQYWNGDNPAAFREIAEKTAQLVPDLGIVVAGAGSGGTITGMVPALREALKYRLVPRRLHAIAVVVEPGGSVGGVRTEIGLLLNGRPGFPWRTHVDDVNPVGLPVSLALSAALWEQPTGNSGKRLNAGESTGFALAGGLLGVLKLECMDKLRGLRDEAGDIHMVFVVPDTREPYREDYEKHGYRF